MGSTLKNVILLAISLVIGMGITYMGTSLMEQMYPLDEQIQIVLAVVLTLFTYVAFYFMTKGSG